ncbi:hypothetical protein RI367_005073 [Sorochytrium milnesiophthora]
MQQRTQEFCSRLEQLNSRQDDLVFCGIDPGRKDVMTVSYGDNPGLSTDIKQRNMGFSVSNSQLRHDSKVKETAHYRDKLAKKHDVDDWAQKISTCKGATSADTIKHLQFVFAPWSYYSKTLDFNCTPAAKHFRWKRYIHTQMATDKVCQRIIDKSGLEGQQARDNLVVCFGDASFDHTSKGHAASPRQKRFRDRLEKVHGITVLWINESNTSQVCNACWHHEKLVKPGGSRDPLAGSITTPLAKPHFIRRCTNISCLMMWNRDVNAARNIRWLGMEMVNTGRWDKDGKPSTFQKPLPQPPKLTETNNTSDTPPLA